MYQEFSFADEFNLYMDDLEKEEERNTGYYRASGMGTCKLKRYWIRTGVEGEALNTKSKRIFFIGHVIHRAMQEFTKARKLSVLQEVELYYKDKGKILLTGHFDDLILTPNGELILVDYKSVNSDAFRFSGAEGKEHYERQLISYGLMIKQQFPEYAKLSDMRLLYISKNDFTFKEQKVFPEPITVKSVIDEIYEMNEYFESKKEPKAEPEASWECGYCPYKIKCPRGQEEIICEQQKAALQKKSIVL